MPASARRFRWLAALSAVWAVCATAPALAASVTDVRVGVHPKFTRLVFELDSSAGYKVEKLGTDAAPELRITIDAAAGARDLRAAGDIRGVKLEAGPKARARIALRQSDVRVREMILSDPPRIVIDLVKSETALAAAPKAEAKPAAKPEPKEIAKSEPKEPVKPALKESAKPAPRETTKAEVAEKPKEIAKESPAPKPPAPVLPSPSPAPTQTAAAPTISPEPAATAALTPAPRVSPSPLPSATASPEPSLAAHPPEPSPSPAIVPPPAISPAPAISPTPDSDAKLAPPTALPTEPPAIEPPPAPAHPMPSPIPAPSVAPEPPPAPAVSWSDRLTDPMSIGAVVVLLLCVAAIWLVRRRRALPNDLDVTAIAEEIEQTDETPSRIPAGGFAMGDDSESRSASSDATFAGLFERSDDRPAPSWSAPMTESAPMETPAPVAPVAAAAEDSLFDDAGAAPAEPDSTQGDDAMNTDMDLPMDRRANPAAARLGGAAAPAASPDVVRMLQDMERRIATLEARLDESNEAREKLERQVAAQSEELRVQRAAIARTQRALRTMTRGDEDKATEPALRDGETQAKTRVTP